MSFQNAVRIVKPEGSPKALMALVGEAPGAKEDAIGRPFVGDSGNLLNTMLKTAKIARSDLYITNVVKERPPDNKINKFIRFTNKGIFTTDAYNHYEMMLKAELEATEANIIVAMGNIPLYALTGHTQITKHRGSFYPSTLLDDRNGKPRKVLCCIHPAKALRKYLDRHLIIHDLILARKHQDTPDIPVTNREYIVNPTFEQAMTYMQDILDHSKECGCDIESMMHRVRNKRCTKALSQISFSKTPYDAISIPFWMNATNYWANEEVEGAIMQQIARILENRNIAKIGQNFMYDLLVLSRFYGIHTHNIHDTRIQQKIAFPDFPAALQHIVSVNVIEPYYKDEREGHLSRENPSKSIYNAKDSCVTQECFHVLKKDVESQHNESVYERHIKVMEPLHYMGEKGIRVDEEAFKTASIEAGRELRQLEDKIAEIVGHPINPRSALQVMDYFYNELGIPPYKKKVKNKETGDMEQKDTAEEIALKRIVRKQVKGSDVAGLILEARGLSKLKGTYYDIPFYNGRFTFFPDPVGTKQGRISTKMDSFGYGTNSQNSPTPFKRGLIADDGYIQIDMDKAQAENRIVAYIGPEPEMIRCFEEGQDIHSKTASLIFGIPLEEVSDVENTSGVSNWSQRKAGKTANHAFNYQLGHDTFSLRYLIPLSDAKYIRNRYLQVYPGVQAYWRWVEAQLSQNRTLINLGPFKRHRIFMDRWGDQMFKGAFSFTPQSTVADLINEWGLIYVYYDPENKFPGLQLQRQVHDSISFQVPLKQGWFRIAQQISSIRDSLDQPLEWHDREFVIPTDCKIGFNYADMEKVDITGSVLQITDSLKKAFIKVRDSRAHKNQFAGIPNLA